MASDRDAAVRAGIEAAYMELTNDGWLKQKDGRVAYVLRGSVTEFYRRVLALLDSPAPETTERSWDLAYPEIGPSSRIADGTVYDLGDEIRLHVRRGCAMLEFTGEPLSTLSMNRQDMQGIAEIFALHDPQLLSAPESVEPPDAKAVAWSLKDRNGLVWLATIDEDFAKEASENGWTAVPLFRHPPTDSTRVGEGDAAALIAVFEAAALGSCDVSRDEAYDALLAALRTSKEAPATEHCWDCCCARSWKALGITEYTGKSIPEHIEELRQAVEAPAVAPAESDGEAPMREHAEAIYRECIAVMRCQCGAETLAMSGGVVCKASREMVTECVGAAPAGEVVAWLIEREDYDNPGCVVPVVAIVGSESEACTSMDAHQALNADAAYTLSPLIRAEDPPSEEGET